MPLRALAREGTARRAKSLGLKFETIWVNLALTRKDDGPQRSGKAFGILRFSDLSGLGARARHRFARFDFRLFDYRQILSPTFSIDRRAVLGGSELSNV